MCLEENTGLLVLIMYISQQPCADQYRNDSDEGRSALTVCEMTIIRLKQFVSTVFSEITLHKVQKINKRKKILLIYYSFMNI